MALTQDRVQCRALVLAVLDLRVLLLGSKLTNVDSFFIKTEQVGVAVTLYTYSGIGLPDEVNHKTRHFYRHRGGGGVTEYR
jgi:hypothetical protein